MTNTTPRMKYMQTAQSVLCSLLTTLYVVTFVQIRLPNGQALTQTFGGKEQLAAVRLYVQMNRTDGDATPFKLMMSFPKKVFTEEDMEKPLCELGK